SLRSQTKTKNFLTNPFSAGGVGGAGKKMKGNFMVLFPPLHFAKCRKFAIIKIQSFHTLYYNLCIKIYNTTMSIANNLKKIRAEKGYSLEKVARLADLSLSTVVKVADGTNQNPTIDTLKKIAKALEIGVDDLIQK
ncbi:MAG: helix-turn-helix transcriptional regulator, partial [Patescibacteria group bacterium]|nr:helix-turn-helix transcriptional regulator [Patescibacteria group bacterium]